VYNAARIPQLDASIVESAGSATTLPANSTDWIQLPWFRFDIPGDAQFTRSTVDEIRTCGGSSATPNAWHDDYELYSLSTGLYNDLEWRTLGAVMPDGNASLILRDRFGQVVGMVEPTGRTTILVRDSLGRVIQSVDPDGNATQYAYIKGLRIVWTSRR
jgi:YD repeat-containing protein